MIKPPFQIPSAHNIWSQFKLEKYPYKMQEYFLRLKRSPADFKTVSSFNKLPANHENIFTAKQAPRKS